MQTNGPAETLDIKIGSPARCRDGRAGRVIKVVVAPGNKQVTDIVVEHGLLLHHDVVVPISLVAGREGDTVVLDLNTSDLNNLREYAEIDFAIPPGKWSEGHDYPPEAVLVDLHIPDPNFGLLAPAWSAVMVQGHTHGGVSGAEIPIGRGTRVVSGEETVGRLDHVLLDPRSGAVRAMVVRKGRLLVKDVIVPVSWVKAVEEDEIVLGADRSLLNKLPEYRPTRSDKEITVDVQQVLDDDERTRGRGILVRVADGVAHLRGVVPTGEAKQAAAEAAGRVEGVWEVDHNELLAESAVAKAVRDALARDPRTTQAAIDVTYLGGKVTLLGQVRSAAEKTAAVEIAGHVPGVAAVIDELEIRGDAKRKSWPAAATEHLPRVAPFAMLQHA
jgi:osmotically-inducible protein OsmY